MVNAERKQTGDKIQKLAVLTILLLLLAYRALVFIEVNAVYVDSDQPYMWLGARDYSEGRFYEPRYYGQNYNTFFEALVAVPLLWCGTAVYYAVPLATHLIWLSPVLLATVWLYRRKKYFAALVIPAIFVCMPLGYHIMSSVPRGFVSGLFFTGTFVISLHQPHNLRWLGINTALAVVAYFLNPNSLLLSAPLLFYLFLHNFRNNQYYIASLLGLLVYIPLYFLLDHFYKIHPDYIVWPLHYEFDPAQFSENLRNLFQSAFIHVSPFTESSPAPLLVLMLLLAPLIWRDDKRAFMALCALVVMIAIACLSGKIKDGTVWPFYSYSRMYLALPLLIALFAGTLKKRSRYVAILLSLVCLVFFSLRTLRLKEDITQHTHPENWSRLRLLKLEDVLNVQNYYKTVCLERGTAFIVVSSYFWLNTYLSSGGPAVDPAYPDVIESYFEKRYHVREKYRNRVLGKFLLLSDHPDFDKENKDPRFTVERLDDYGMFLVIGNTLELKDFIQNLKEIELPRRDLPVDDIVF